jgi:hypothetical protein
MILFPELPNHILNSFLDIHGWLFTVLFWVVRSILQLDVQFTKLEQCDSYGQTNHIIHTYSKDMRPNCTS